MADERPVFGGEAERIGTKLDEATDEFLKETKTCRALQIPAGQGQLSAMEFASYLGINLVLEPEVAWIAREMVAAPMPPNAKMKISNAGVVYFHDTVNDYFTVEHPLTQRYLKVLERERLDLLCTRTKPSVDGLIFKQPEMLFHKEFPQMQIPCQSCNVMQASMYVHQSMMSMCQGCFDCLHKNANGPRKDFTYTSLPCGSLCSACSVKMPQLYSAKYQDYFCFGCWEEMHKNGRDGGKVMLLELADGDMIATRMCEECESRPAMFACDYCLDVFCASCFWKCHMNGNRRNHTASKMNVVPMCSQCGVIRATVFCEQTQELMCTECFTMTHAKGNRMLHLMKDATDLLVLLERLDPAFQEHMRRARPRILWAISQLQGWARGLEARKHFKKRKDVVIMIQRRWKGVQTRRKLLGMLHLHKWRRRQVNSYFLPKSADDRAVVKQKAAAMLAAKDVAARATNANLRELRDTVVNTATADPMEDVARTRATLEEHGPVSDAAQASQTALADGGMSPRAAAPATTALAQLPSGPSAYTTFENTSRFNGTITGPIAGGAATSAAIGDRGADLSTRDLRQQKDDTLRQITGLK